MSILVDLIILYLLNENNAPTWCYWLLGFDMVLGLGDAVTKLLKAIYDATS